MKEILTRLFTHEKLAKQEATSILKQIANAEYSDAEVASFLTVFLMRPITPDELAGFRQAMLELCVSVDVSQYNPVDVCGTGGDGKNTFNISTLTAFVLAGAGIHVVKHGNYSVSSHCGSSNVLEHLGYKFSSDSDKLAKELDEAGICYLHAPVFHPAMKNVAPVRKALKVKTFFNMLGPMVNPAKPANQFVGVFNKEVMQLYKGVYDQTDVNYMLIHSNDGYDEISLTAPFSIISRQGQEEISPEQIGLKTIKEEGLFGGNSIPEAVGLFQDILKGSGTQAQNQVVTANAAFALKLYHPDKSIADCLGMAEESLKSGKAWKSLSKLIELNK